MINNVEKVKKLYDNGYRCIRYEYEKDNSLSIYFKNFEEEDVAYVNCKNGREIDEIKTFIGLN